MNSLGEKAGNLLASVEQRVLWEHNEEAWARVAKFPSTGNASS